jgi:hypothetical protein
LADLTLRICGVTIRLMADDGRFLVSARRRYGPFTATGTPDLSLYLALAREKFRPFREEPRVVWDGRSGRVERHDLELDLAPGVGRAAIVRGHSPLDSLLRIVLRFVLVRRGGFLCHSAAVEGWLFPGLSGAGKSTLGRSVPKARLLADELVGVGDGKLWGTPFRGDFLVGRNNVVRPLTAILHLDRHAPRGVRPAGKAEGLRRLLQCVLYFGDDLRSGRTILAFARRCVEKVPTFVLSYDARKTRFSGVESMIMEALA